ncbi:hypothetical protein BDR26DRAFT_869043 [Obelidium mucronatum]|nr:hypothetical protein BDR26DRAFT_869043 [Obelidium mucronatum]
MFELPPSIGSVASQPPTLAAAMPLRSPSKSSASKRSEGRPREHRTRSSSRRRSNHAARDSPASFPNTLPRSRPHSHAAPRAFRAAAGTATVVLTPLRPASGRRRRLDSQPPATPAAAAPTSILDRLGPPTLRHGGKKPHSISASRQSKQTINKGFGIVITEKPVWPLPPRPVNVATASSPSATLAVKDSNRRNDNTNNYKNHSHHQKRGNYQSRALPSSSDLFLSSTHSDDPILHHPQLSPTATANKKKKKKKIRNRKRAGGGGGVGVVGMGILPGGGGGTSASSGLPHHQHSKLLQTRDAVEAAKRRARRNAALIAKQEAEVAAAAAASSSSAAVGTKDSTALDLGRDGFMQLMREAGLGNRSFRIITREDLLFGNQDDDEDNNEFFVSSDSESVNDGDNEQYYHDDGTHSEISYEGGDFLSDEDVDEDAWMGHAESDSMEEEDDDDLDAVAGRNKQGSHLYSEQEQKRQDLEGGDEFQAELDDEIEAALAALRHPDSKRLERGIVLRNRVKMRVAVTDSGNGPKMLVQVYGDDGVQVLRTPVLVYENSSGETVYRPVDVTPRPHRPRSSPDSKPAVLSLPTVAPSAAVTVEVASDDDSMEL